MRFQLRFYRVRFRLQVGERRIGVLLLCRSECAGFSDERVERFLPGLLLGFGPRLERRLELGRVLPRFAQIFLNVGFERGPIRFQLAFGACPARFAIGFLLLNRLFEDVALRPDLRKRVLGMFFVPA